MPPMILAVQGGVRERPEFVDVELVADTMVGVKVLMTYVGRTARDVWVGERFVCVGKKTENTVCTVLEIDKSMRCKHRNSQQSLFSLSRTKHECLNKLQFTIWLTVY